MVVLQFYTHEAIPLSKLMIFAGAFTSFCLGFKLKHPHRNAIAIDYNIPLLLCPMLLFGTMVGVTINKILPPIVIIVSLTFVLVINTYKTFLNGKKLYKEEIRVIKSRKSDRSEKIIENKNCHNGKTEFDMYKIDNISDKSDYETNQSDNHSISSKEATEQINRSRSNSWTTNDSSTKSKYDDYNGKYSSVNSINPSLNKNEIKKKTSGENGIVNNILISENSFEIKISNNTTVQLLKIEETKDLEKFPKAKYLIMFISYAIMLLTTLFKGSEHVSSILGVEPCSAIYWIIFMSYFPFAFSMTLIIAKMILNEFIYRKSIGYKIFKDDIQWDTNLFIKFPIYSFISGCLSGMLGIGGGLILGPLLLEVGLHPVVSSATSNFLVLFTSSSTSLQFMLHGMMRVEFGIVFIIISVLGSFLGTKLIQSIIKKTGRYSYIIFTLMITLLISAILIPGEAIVSFFSTLSEETSIFEFKSPCNK